MSRFPKLASLGALGVVAISVAHCQARHEITKVDHEPPLSVTKAPGSGGTWSLPVVTNPKINVSGDLEEWKPRYQSPSLGGRYGLTSYSAPWYGATELQQFDYLLGGRLLVSSVGTIFSSDETEAPFSAPGAPRAEDPIPTSTDPTLYPRQEGAGMNIRPIWTQYIVPQYWPSGTAPNWDFSKAQQGVPLQLDFVHLDGRVEAFLPGNTISTGATQTWYSTLTVDRYIDLVPTPNWTPPQPVTPPTCCPGQGACMLPRTGTCPGNTGGSTTTPPESPQCHNAFVLHEIGDEQTGPGNHDVYFNLYPNPDYLPQFTLLPGYDQVTAASGATGVFTYSFMKEHGEFMSLENPFGDTILSVTWGTPCPPSGVGGVFPGSCVTGNEQDFVALMVSTDSTTSYLYYQHGSACDSGAPQLYGCNGQGNEYDHDFLVGIASFAPGANGSVAVAEQLSYDASGRYLGVRDTAAIPSGGGYVPAAGFRSAGHVASYALDGNNDSLDIVAVDNNVRPYVHATFSGVSLGGYTATTAMQLAGNALPATTTTATFAPAPTTTYTFTGTPSANTLTGVSNYNAKNALVELDSSYTWDPVTNDFLSASQAKDVNNVTTSKQNDIWSSVASGPWFTNSGRTLLRLQPAAGTTSTSGGSVAESLENDLGANPDTDGRYLTLTAGPNSAKVTTVTYTAGPGDDVATVSDYPEDNPGAAAIATESFTYYPLPPTPYLGAARSTDFWQSEVKTRSRTLANGVQEYSCSETYELTWPFRKTVETCTDEDGFQTTEAWNFAGTMVAGTYTHTFQAGGSVGGANLAPPETVSWSKPAGYYQRQLDVMSDTINYDPITGNSLSEQTETVAVASTYDIGGAFQSVSVSNKQSSLAEAYTQAPLDANGNGTVSRTTGTTGNGATIMNPTDLSQDNVAQDDSVDFIPTMMQGWGMTPPNTGCACQGTNCYVPVYYASNGISAVPVYWPGQGDTPAQLAANVGAMVCCHQYTPYPNTFPALPGPNGTNLVGNDPGPDARIAYVSKQLTKKQPWNLVSASFGQSQSQETCGTSGAKDVFESLNTTWMEPAVTCDYWTQTSNVDGSPANPPTAPWASNAVMYSQTFAETSSPAIPPGIAVVETPVNDFQGWTAPNCGGPWTSASNTMTTQVPPGIVTIQISPITPTNPKSLLLPWQQICQAVLIQNVAGESNQGTQYQNQTSCWADAYGGNYTYDNLFPPPTGPGEVGQSCNINPYGTGYGGGSTPDGCCNYYLPFLPNGCGSVSSNPVQTCQ
jgi:hypothetical protein